MNPFLRILIGLILLASPACRADAPPAPPASVSAPLRKAREMLRLAEETRARIQRQLDGLRASGQPDPALEADYRTYLERVRKMAEAYARIVREMEALAGPAAAANTPADPDPGAGIDATAAPEVALPDEDALDPIRALDRELNAALSEFDKILLKEHAEIGAKMEEVAQANQEKLQELAQQAAEAAAKIKDKQAGKGQGTSGAEGAEAGAEGGEEGAETAGQPAGEKGGEAGGEQAGKTAGGPGMKPGEHGKPGDPEAGGETAGPANGGSTGAGQGGASTTAGKPGEKNGKGGRVITRPGAEDDDIVARQLREAAEAETDPVMKEKLWKEYDEYKKSSRR